MNDSKGVWKTVPLGALAEFRNGINYSKDNFGKGVKVINVKDFQDLSLAPFENLDEINPNGIVKEENFLLDGDIIFVRSNGNRQLIGRSLFVSKPLEKVTHSAFTIRTRFVSKHVFPRFFAYLFRSNIIRQYLSAHGNGTNISNLNQNILSNLEVPLPPFCEQRKIASILSTYDDLIENNTRRIEILEQMAKLIYEEWFVKFRFPGYEKVKMVSSELGEIPEGWEVKKLPDLCSKVIDGTHDSPKPSEKGYFLVTGKHIVNGFINFSDCYLISPEEHSKVIQRSKPEKGDIIFSNIGTLGSIALVDQDFEFSIKNVALFKPLENLYSNYLYLYFSLPETYNRMERKASGTSQKFFSLNFLRNLKIVEPPKDLLHKFDNAVKPLIEERSILNKKNQNLLKTRDLLLPKLTSGEIDVSDLDIRIRNEFQERNFNFGEPQDEKRFRVKMV